MKTMTCKQMGGPCEEKIKGATPDEMIKNGMVHMEKAHPKMAADVKAMAKADPQMIEWNKKFKEDWKNTPDDK